MNDATHRGYAQDAIDCLCEEMTEEKYPPYVGVLIATGASLLLWAIIGTIAAAWG